MASYVYVCSSCGDVYQDPPPKCDCGAAGDEMREELVRSIE